MCCDTKGRSFAAIFRADPAYEFEADPPAPRRAGRDDEVLLKSGRANLAQKLGDLAAQMLTLPFQRLGGMFDVLRGGRGGIRVGFDAADIIGDILGALRGVLGAARDLLRGGALLLDRGCDRGRDLVHFADNAADSLDLCARLGIDRRHGPLHRRDGRQPPFVSMTSPLRRRAEWKMHEGRQTATLICQFSSVSTGCDRHRAAAERRLSWD